MNIEMKRSFVLADWMKAAKRCKSEEEFRILLVSEKSRVSLLCERELDQIIGRDESRLERFEHSNWKLEDVAVSDCIVWPEMGGRPWAVGSVREVADRFLRMEAAGRRVWRMKLFAGFFASEIPLIMFRRNGRLEIDDGSHRAVAMHLAGIARAKAYIGVENGGA
jgi:hypothetical protein